MNFIFLNINIKEFIKKIMETIFLGGKCIFCENTYSSKDITQKTSLKNQYPYNCCIHCSKRGILFEEEYFDSRIFKYNRNDIKTNYMLKCYSCKEEKIIQINGFTTIGELDKEMNKCKCKT